MLKTIGLAILVWLVVGGFIKSMVLTTLISKIELEQDEPEGSSIRDWFEAFIGTIVCHLVWPLVVFDLYGCYAKDVKKMRAKKK